MKNIKLLLLSLILIIVISCNKTTGNQNLISGRVFYLDSSEPAKGADVYLDQNSSFIDYGFNRVDNTTTTSNGYYIFNKPGDNYSCRIYAALENASGRIRRSYISPIKYLEISNSDEQIVVEDIFLYEIYYESMVYGKVINAEDQEIIEDAKIVLYKLIDGQYIKTDSTFSGHQGNYQFNDVQTGNYFIEGIATSDFVDRISTSFPIFTDGIDNLNLDLHLSNSEDYKPAIYIYPEEDQQFQVKLKLNNRTQITTSIPEYTNGWDVFVEKSGKIDHKYDYLFYETSIIYLPKFSKGWCFNKSDLENEIKCLLENIGLNTKEKKEFLDFWIYKLQKYDFYKIYPIFNESINYYVELEIVPPSETTFRFRFFFEGCDNFEELPEPEIPAFERTGTTVVEWGGVMVN